MPLLSDLRNYVLRRRSRLPMEVHDPNSADVARSLGAVGENGTRRPELSVAIEPKPITSRGRSMAELQRSYDDVMTLIRKISDHLDKQSSRHERLQETLDRLPQALEVLPEINRQNARLLDVLTEHLDEARKRESILNDTLTRISEASRQQTEVLGLLRQQLSVNNQSARHISDTLGEFRQTLSDLAQSNTQAVQVLSTMAAASELRESRLESMVGRSQKWMIAMIAVCGTGTITALVIALITLLR